MKRYRVLFGSFFLLLTLSASSQLNHKFGRDSRQNRFYLNRALQDSLELHRFVPKTDNVKAYTPTGEIVRLMPLSYFIAVRLTDSTRRKWLFTALIIGALTAIYWFVVRKNPGLNRIVNHVANSILATMIVFVSILLLAMVVYYFRG